MGHWHDCGEKQIAMIRRSDTMAICGYGQMAIGLVMWGWRPNLPQPWISHCGHLAFGGYSQIAIGLVMYIKLYLLAISFLILEGDILDKLLPSTWWRSYDVYRKQLFVLAAGAVILPTTWLNYLSMLAYVLAVGLISSVALRRRCKKTYNLAL
uniref:Amino acid transporter transmembrane domain-containing protein n=1 Tax=Oryza glumipatula TaxID=40148 RepID=A0A0E0ACG9_9ORYZ